MGGCARRKILISEIFVTNDLRNEFEYVHIRTKPEAARAIWNNVEEFVGHDNPMRSDTIDESLSESSTSENSDQHSVCSFYINAETWENKYTDLQ